MKFPWQKAKPTIKSTAVKYLHQMVEDYSEWYDDHGLYLPPDYASDPTGWTEALHVVKRAFKLLNDEMNGEGELWEAKHAWEQFGEKDSEKIIELEKEIKAGLTIFGAQLLYLSDLDIYKEIKPSH